MAKRKSKSVASESRLFVLALGLLVGFSIAFVFILSRLPVDSVISQYNDDASRGAQIEQMNFDYYAVLQEQKAARKPAPVAEPQVVFIEPPAQATPQIQSPPAAPAVAPQTARVSPEALLEQPVAAPRLQQRSEQQPSLVTPPPPAVLSAPQAKPGIDNPVRRSVAVREMLASNSGQASYYVEAGTFENRNDALRAQSLLRNLGLESFIVVRQDDRGGFDHRVRIGPFFEQSRLDKTRARLRAGGITPKLIRVKG